MLELSQLQSAATQPPHTEPEDATGDQSALPEDIYFQPIDAIVEYANKNDRTIKMKVLDIDDTLLMQVQDSDTDEPHDDIKCYGAWTNLMKRARENDKANNTITVWAIGTFRTLVGGIYEIIDGKELLRPEITFLLQIFEEYINRNLIFATGGEEADGRPGCKVKNILNWLHEIHGIAKDNIAIYDDQFNGVILPARLSGYEAIWIPSSEALAEASISSDPVVFSKWSFRSTFWGKGQSQSMPDLSRDDEQLTLGF